MTLKRCIAVAAIVMTVATLVQAQGTLNGTWEGETRAGSSIVLTLVVKDAALTGTLVRNGQSTALTEGKVTKDTFSFKATLNDQIEGLSGTLEGGEIKIWLDREGPSSAIVLRRATRK